VCPRGPVAIRLRERGARLARILLAPAHVLTCWSEHDRGTGEQSKSHAPRGGLRQLRPDELTDELIRVSERLLERHADAPVGTELPFSHGGRRYVARIEEHINATNDPKRLPGKHKGVTLFTPNR
jgi:hypothetical protein